MKKENEKRRTGIIIALIVLAIIIILMLVKCNSNEHQEEPTPTISTTERLETVPAEPSSEPSSIEHEQRSDDGKETDKGDKNVRVTSDKVSVGGSDYTKPAQKPTSTKPTQKPSTKPTNPTQKPEIKPTKPDTEKPVIKRYVVKSYDENGTLLKRVVRNAKLGTKVSVTAADKSLKGYVFIPGHEKNVLKGVVTKKTLVLRLYFKKDVVVPEIKEAEYSVSWLDKDGNILKYETRKAKVGTEVSVTATDKVLDGYTFLSDYEKNVLKGIVKGNNSLALKLYFNKDVDNPPEPEEASYTVMWYDVAGGIIKSEVRQAKIGEEVSVTAADKSVAGYYFVSYSSSNVLSGIVKEDNSLTLKLYFRKETSGGDTTDPTKPNPTDPTKPPQVVPTDPTEPNPTDPTKPPQVVPTDPTEPNPDETTKPPQQQPTDKPEDQPTDKPVEKPSQQQPSDKPEVNPPAESKPADKEPVDKPEEQPKPSEKEEKKAVEKQVATRDESEDSDEKQD